ncbi:MAG: glycosyltransferase family 2 protein [Candidatus Diapherotrites archaeon]|nr:glycosyltransferase family 2 protein [Candidatus Diapherotrites archaeon]
MIPAFNEEKTIAQVIKETPKKIFGIKKIEILVVNDGSTDETERQALKAGAKKIVSHKTNKGLGVAFKTGIEAALDMGADVIVNIDADMQFNPKEIPKIIQPIIDGKADLVTCSRFKDKSIEPKMPKIKKLGNSIFTKIVSWLTKQEFTDTQCGFRAYSRECALRLNLFAKHTYTQETLLDAVEKGMCVAEVPCKVKGERSGKSRVVQSWFSYSIKALLIIVRTIRDHKPLKFFGTIGAVFLLTGGISALILWLRLLLIHKIDPFMWIVYTDVILIVVGFLLIILALIADMNARQKKTLDEIFYRLKKQETQKKSK